MRFRFHTAALAAAVLAGTAQAQIPSTAPYVTDPQNVYVQDDTSQGIGNLNMVLCIIGSLDPGDMVNTGPYIALVDVDKCNNKGGGSNSSATGATNFATAVVNVTRASNSDPMVGKVWMSLTQQGQSMKVYAYLSATQSPTDAPPYGVFRMDYIGKKNGQTGFNGYVNSQPGTISFLETGSQSSNTALAMSAGSTTSGTGSMSIASGGGGGSSATFNFAYDSSYFRRSDGTNDECFDRSKAHASVSVWQYGTYNANDGTRVDQAFPGFPILATYNSTTYYGFANYWGINFQGLDLNSIPDASPIAGLSVTDQRPSNTTAYNLSKVSGKLTKWTQMATTIGALDGIPFMFWADLNNQTSNQTLAASNTNNGSWIGQWGQNGVLTVTGTQSCGSNGCVPISFPGSATMTVNASFLASNPINGWSDSLGGNLSIPVPTGAAHVGTDPVYYYTQSTVIPGSAGAPTALYCLSQCPTSSSLSAFLANPSGSPFASPTNTQFGWGAQEVSYTFGASGLLDGAPASVEMTSAPSNSQWSNGLMTGRLYTTDLANSGSNACPNTPGTSTPAAYCEPDGSSVYYTWQTGPNQWSQSLWLTKASDNSVVAFDAPQNIPYTVPTGTAYGTFAGKSILLQFNGFGNLSGIPGYCVDPVTNATVNCDQNARYVPMFSIADGATMTLAGTPAVPLIVKALDAEIRLKSLGASASTACASMSLNAMTLPSGGTHDPSNSGDSEYLGTMPAVTGAPKVIDGVLQ
ncbi:MAG TPA: hypothetical protein VH278_09650 [Burkholderiaceae bacterium]|nr:hypothetical protein [Burkholderiaceae bacterium]